MNSILLQPVQLPNIPQHLSRLSTVNSKVFEKFGSQINPSLKLIPTECPFNNPQTKHPFMFLLVKTTSGRILILFFLNVALKPKEHFSTF